MDQNHEFQRYKKTYKLFDRNFQDTVDIWTITTWRFLEH